MFFVVVADSVRLGRMRLFGFKLSLDNHMKHGLLTLGIGPSLLVKARFLWTFIDNLSDAGTMTGLIINDAILIMGIKSYLRYISL